MVILILIGSIFLMFVIVRSDDEVREISISEVLDLTSTRNNIDDIVIASDESPTLALISTPAACWYHIGGFEENSGTDTEGSDNTQYGLKPLLIANHGALDSIQYKFIEKSGFDSSMIIGDVDHSKGSVNFQETGTPAEISLAVAKYVYMDAAGALIIEDCEEGYELGVSATPIASYLNVPVIIVDSDTSFSNLRSKLRSLDIKYTIILGDRAKSIARKLNFDCILLESHSEINENVLEVVQHRFNEINYITMTNPSDVIPPRVIEIDHQTYETKVNNVKIETANVEKDIIGTSTHTFDISVPDGINRIQIFINFTKVESTPLDPFKNAVEIEPVIFASLFDPNGNIAGYAPSFSYDVGKDYIETQVFNCSGNYNLLVEVYYGTRGFSTYAGTQLGVSKIEATFEVSAVISTLSEAHLPMNPKLSLMAPYVSAAHGGIVLADPNFELTSDSYARAAKGYCTGPWYETGLHEAVNDRVRYVVEMLNQTIESLNTFDLYDGYLDGPAWLAILAGPNMIPQYYEPKDPSWVEDPVYGTGWVTDLKYSLDLQLSTARLMAQDVGDVSTLVARTLFYEQYVQGHTEMIKQEYGASEEWGTNFHFLAGEMGGRTGWFFWQRDFAPEIEDHGFNTEQYYQNHENDRQTMVLAGAYERANYFDLMMHGNWYWYVTELNGLDSYSTSVKVSDIIKAEDDWELGPSTIVTGSCIMGRIDGIPPRQSLTFAFIHAGVNAFYSASRSTGSEAKAGTIERSLLYDDISVGEALRLDKTVNFEPAAFFVRNLFADPAFNPYEPENGFSDQGRPKLTGEIEEVDGSQSETSSSSTEGNSASRGTIIQTETDLDSYFTQYHTYETMMNELNDMAENHSNIVSLFSLDTTYEGREIWTVKVSDNPLEYENEPEILFTGAHHGREWPSYEVPLYLLRYLVENYGQPPTDNDDDGLINEDPFDGLDNDGDGLVDEDEEEARITWLVDNRQIWFIPMVNPDGVEFAHSQVAAGETNYDILWRKNREPNKNPTTGQPYPEHLAGKAMWGTDLNRNYGFHWGELGYQGYADPSREDYIGPLDKTDDDNDRRVNEDKTDNLDNDGDGRVDEDPRGGFSTVETRAIKKLVEEHDFVIAMNFHTYAEKIYWPWMWTLELTPDEDIFCFLAEGMAKFNGYGYRNMSDRAQQELSRHPPVDGDSNDWMYGKHQILSYTIELGTQFILPEDEIVQLCKINLGANLLVVEAADNPWQYKYVIKHDPLKNTANTDNYKVRAVIKIPRGMELQAQSVKVYYTADGKNYDIINMAPSKDSNEYEGVIPGQEPGTKVSYYISVTNKEELTTQAPKYAPYNVYSFNIIESEASPAILCMFAIIIMGAIILAILSRKYVIKHKKMHYK